MEELQLLVLVAVAGLAAGLAGFYLSQAGGGYCERVEQSVRQNASFNGTIDCYPPSQAAMNFSDAVENRTELRCVCEKSYMGETSIFTINVPG